MSETGRSGPERQRRQLFRRSGSPRVEYGIHAALGASGFVSVFVSFAIIFVLVQQSLPFFGEVSPAEFFTGTRWAPLLEPRSFGVLPLIGGTLIVTVIAAAMVIPIGSLAAIYLSEYAKPGVRKALKPALEVLAGIPTVVYGYFAVMVVTPGLRLIVPQTPVFNALSAGLVVGIMIIPTVASLSDDAMQAVPSSLREAAYGLGATKYEVSLGVVFPAAFSGILSSYLLAISRAIGETMIVHMAAGATPNLTINPLESVQTMTGYIVQVSLGDTPAGTVEYQTIFAVGLTLFAMTLIMNLWAIRIRRRFREVYG